MDVAFRKKTWIIAGQRTQVCLGSLVEIMELARLQWPPTLSIFILTDSSVGPLYLDLVHQSFSSYYSRIGVKVVPSGEAYKSLSTAHQVITELLIGGFGRDSVLVALGGGVICDLAGLVAATYQRGIDLFLLPTTLLAQVDAALGGKYGVNHTLAKNSIGGTRHPALIGLYVPFLSSLPSRVFCSGFGELVKYGMVCSGNFFKWLMLHAEDLLRRNLQDLSDCIWWAVHLKYAIVQTDSEDRLGRRAILNFGHTFAHAIESAQGYAGLLHGEAVGVGMILATAFATWYTALPKQIGSQLDALLAIFQLPRSLPNMTAEMYVKPMRYDKKCQGGSLRLVLPKALGQGVLMAVDSSVLHKWLQQHLASFCPACLEE